MFSPRLNWVERTGISTSDPEVLEQFLGTAKALSLALVQFLHHLDGECVLKVSVAYLM